METSILKDMIAVIRTEQLRREVSLTGEDPNFADDQRLFRDAPFVNELSLMLLVALRHQVERELVGLAARATGDGKDISGQQYEEKVRQVRGELRKQGGWKAMSAQLRLECWKGHTSMEVLCLLANSYKHNPSFEPDRELLEFLKLETGVPYLPLPESQVLQDRLAVFNGLGNGVNYCDIAERFVDIASDFLEDVQKHTKLSPVKWGPTSFNPEQAAR